MATRNSADGISHTHHRQTECKKRPPIPRQALRSRKRQAAPQPINTRTIVPSISAKYFLIFSISLKVDIFLGCIRRWRVPHGGPPHGQNHRRGTVTASPPAKTPARVVRPSASAVRHPRRSVSNPEVVAANSGLGDVPSAMMTTSHGTSNSDPSFSTGLRRPLSSGSPSVISTHRSPRTQPLLVAEHLDRIGEHPKTILLYGAPPRHAPEAPPPNGGRRSSPPHRAACRAHGVHGHALPPPTTTTRCPT